MPKMIIAIDGVVMNEVELAKERTTLGRRPYNDVVIDNLAISGEHAVLHMPAPGGLVEIEDLQSTNGTYVNGTPIQRQVLRSGDVIEMGKYKIRFMQDEGQADAYEHTLVFKPGMAPPRNQSTRPAPLAGAMPLTATPPPAVAAPTVAAIRVLTGPAAGREVALTKVVTTLGKPGVAVASITRRHDESFALAHVEGLQPATLNGTTLGAEGMPLRHGDRIELAGTAMEFVVVS
ncbi:FHA domain-containing protein [Paracidovorax wautersii]|uniref:FHA domain-containing protein n=1 Tax=Paracidovorax wautersii TaxID=1177982 RepID=A0A1I2FF74_9BURK|nr:FHA domain-containing protein [Paracidovorax wautersii]SFF03230.1 FHA domain-containing protein [Paracidovorax wautersii]